MHVCMYYVFMYVRTYVSMYIYTYVCIYVCTYSCVYMYVCTYIRTRVCMYAYMYVSERAIKSGSKHMFNMHVRDLHFIDWGVKCKIGNTVQVFVKPAVEI
jgi:hypothetical protein